MVVELLAEHRPSMPVAAIFMKGKSKEGPEKFLISVMRSVYCQLVAKRYGHANFGEESDLGTQDLEGFRRSIYRILRDLPCAFLVLDDLDQCGYQHVELLEEELVGLREHGLGIMTTSRVARYTKQSWCCRLKKGHLIETDCEVWICSECWKETEPLNEEERDEMIDNLLICTSCKEANDVTFKCYR
jgi:hypothetical protein